MLSGISDEQALKGEIGDVTSASRAADGLACNSCRKAKLRCSRDKPECAHCRKTGLDCVYETKRIKPGLKSGAVENLHRRLDELESRLEERTPGGSKCNHETHNANGDGSSEGQNNAAAYEILALLAKELPKLVNGPSSQAASSPASTTPSNKRRRVADDFVASPYARSGSTPTLPEPPILDLVISAYFTHVHPWIPMIHQGRFTRRMASQLHQEHVQMLLYAMTMAASKFVPAAAALLAQHARMREWVICKAMERLSLESLQALTVTAFVDIGNGDGDKAWSIVGSLTRTVEYMQLAQEQEDGGHKPFCLPRASLPDSADWAELEERRRVFWNVFLLDRFCSVTMGWNTSLTADDVYRRLPCDGHLWRKEVPVLTPFFGIWDKSKGHIGNPIGYITRPQSPSHAAADTENGMSNGQPQAMQMPDMSNAGAFAYNIEASESMSRVVSYFLQQKINLHDHNDISSWLTRFKELDLRLVHWKMLLPHRWKANPNLTKEVPMMDPNLTTAHVTHNASMILLHQLVAYPPLHWDFRHRLPSGCSAEACFSAGIEIATITENFLARSPFTSPGGYQLAFCLFIAARVLICHWRYNTGTALAPEFWSLLNSLLELSKRWLGPLGPTANQQDLYASYAARLKYLHELCEADPSYLPNAMDYTTNLTLTQISNGSNGAPHDLRALQPPNLTLPSNLAGATEFDLISPLIMDQGFGDMERIITFDDGSMFAAVFDAPTGTW